MSECLEVCTKSTGCKLNSSDTYAYLNKFFE